ncbi:hypothetical protein C8Q79DRAFT_945997 [Trametes meyenii]|nr:hypothetical protein C8Q79DRAFT_945997 [Trametes meyenii]
MNSATSLSLGPCHFPSAPTQIRPLPLPPSSLGPAPGPCASSVSTAEDRSAPRVASWAHSLFQRDPFATRPSPRTPARHQPPSPSSR